MPRKYTVLCHHSTLPQCFPSYTPLSSNGPFWCRRGVPPPSSRRILFSFRTSYPGYQNLVEANLLSFGHTHVMRAGQGTGIYMIIIHDHYGCLSHFEPLPFLSWGYQNIRMPKHKDAIKMPQSDSSPHTVLPFSMSSMKVFNSSFTRT